MKFALVLALASACYAQTYGRPNILRDVGIDQKLGMKVPLDTPLTDEAGRSVTLRQFMGKPVVLALVYYQCTSLCNLVLNGIATSIKTVNLKDGEDYNVVAVSFDPRETAQLAAAKKKSYDQPKWHFLTASESASQQLADAVGFHYKYEAKTNQYVHASTLIVLTPEGRISSYLYGIHYRARDLRLALVEASSQKIGTPVDQILLYCFHYDPANGKYGFAVMNALRVGGFLTLGLMLGFIFFSLRKEDRPRG